MCTTSGFPRQPIEYANFTYVSQCVQMDLLFLGEKLSRPLLLQCCCVVVRIHSFKRSNHLVWSLDLLNKLCFSSNDGNITDI